MGLVVVLALVLRWDLDGVRYYTADQERDIEAAAGIRRGEWPTVGPKIGQSHFHLGPLHYYTVALDEALGGYGEGVPVFALLSSLGVGAWTLGLSWLWRRRTALAAGLVMAVSPLMIVHSRELWNPALLTPTSGLFVCGIGWAARGRSGGYGVAATSGALMVQAHAVAVLFVAAWPLWVARRFARWGALDTFGVLLAACLTVPWLWDALLTVARSGLGEVTSYLRESAGSVSFLSALSRLATVEHYQGRLIWSEHGGLATAAEWCGIALFVLIALGAIRAVARRLPRAAAMCAVLLMSLVAVSLLSRHAYYYYLETAMPVRCAFAGVAAVGVFESLRRRVWKLIWASCVTLVLGVPVANTLVAYHQAGATGVLASAINPDVRVREERPRSVSRALTWRAQHELLRVLRERAVTRKMLLARGRGPWWPDLVTKLPDEVQAVDRESPLLVIRHNEDPWAIPGGSQLIRRVTAGPTEVLWCRSVIDWREVGVSLSGREVPVWIPWEMVVSAIWSHPEVEFVVRLDSAHARVRSLVVSTAFDATVSRVSAGGVRLQRTGVWRWQGVEVAQFAVTRGAPELECVEIRVAGELARGRPVVLDVLDIWEPR